jgi:hypothetical protein
LLASPNVLRLGAASPTFDQTKKRRLASQMQWLELLFSHGFGSYS